MAKSLLEDYALQEGQRVQGIVNNILFWLVKQLFGLIRGKKQKK